MKRIKQPIPSYFELLKKIIGRIKYSTNHRPLRFKSLKVDTLRQIVPSFSWSSLATKATILIILTCVIPLSIIGWYFTTQTMASLTKAAVEKNNKVCQEAMQAVSSISMLASRNTSGAHEIAAVCEEQTSASQEITFSIEKLHGMSYDLQNLVSQFKV